MTHTRDDVLRASASWVWFPRGSEQDQSDLQLVRYPARLGGGVRASQADSTSDAGVVLDRAIDRTKRWGESQLTVWTSAADRPDLESELRLRGAEHIDTVAVFAAPLEAVRIEVPADATAEVVRTREQVREVDSVNVPVWGQSPLDEEGISAELAEISAALASGEGACVLGRLDGEAVSTGGCTIIDGFVRLWGAATIETARGRGAYRAVLAERLRVGSELGARTALVKGRVSTSAPILTRVGFEHYGDEHAYRLTV